MTEPTKGFVVVASKNHNFYLYALNLCESIREYYEDAKICLVTEERFLDGREEVADDVVLCDDHYRAKIYGMAKSPYDITMYIDADMEVQHEDIVTVWDELKDYDMVWSELTDDRDYIYAERDFDTPEGKRKFTLCGAVCLYDMRTPIVREPASVSPLGGAAVVLGARNGRLRFPKVLVRHNANTCNNNN